MHYLPNHQLYQQSSSSVPIQQVRQYQPPDLLESLVQRGSGVWHLRGSTFRDPRLRLDLALELLLRSELRKNLRLLPACQLVNIFGSLLVGLYR